MSLTPHLPPPTESQCTSSNSFNATNLEPPCCTVKSYPRALFQWTNESEKTKGRMAKLLLWFVVAASICSYGKFKSPPTTSLAAFPSSFQYWIGRRCVKGKPVILNYSFLLFVTKKVRLGFVPVLVILKSERYLDRVLCVTAVSPCERALRMPFRDIGSQVANTIHCSLQNLPLLKAAISKEALHVRAPHSSERRAVPNV